MSVSLLVEETGEYYRPVPSHCQTLSHNVVSSTPRMILIRTHNFIAIQSQLYFHTITMKQSLIFSMFQNAVIGHVAINITMVEYALG